jgi:drug/metabolite transporter (DMT)-like permease
MKNTLFYLATILIWGSTWIGIKMQLGSVEPMVSVTYRFGLAALILLIWCRVRGLNMRFTRPDHSFMFLQGILLFGFNYLLFYIAELYIASGLAAVLFSTIVLMNIVNGALFLKSPVSGRVVFGGVLGLVGIILVFKNEITSFSIDNAGLTGFLLCLAATLLASWGNIVSARNQKKNLPIIQTNAYGMGYGALVMLLVSLFTGKAFTFDMSVQYAGSLIYLALFGSVIAFGCYLTLVGSIGADRAAYATLLFPIVALAISTIWEDYQWTGSAASGVGLIILGNLVILRKGVLARSEHKALRLLRSVSKVFISFR